MFIITLIYKQSRYQELFLKVILTNTPYVRWVILCLALGILRAEGPTTRLQDGYKVLGIENAYWSIEVVQGLGGKVISLQDQISGREWMWSREKVRSLSRPTADDAFGAGNTLGWDELFPNLRETVWNNKVLKGHGLLWRADIDIDEEAWREGRIHSVIDLEALSIRYEREITLKDSVVNVRYRIENTGDKPFPYLWALHPLFTIHPGDELLADLSAEKFRVEGAPGIPALQPGAWVVWPGKAFGINLEKLFLGHVPKAGIKFFVESPEDGRISIQNSKSGARLTLRYEKEALPYLAVWLSRGVWGNAHHIAIEPTNRPNEILSEKTPDDDPSGWVLPGAVREWHLYFENHSQ